MLIQPRQMSVKKNKKNSYSILYFWVFNIFIGFYFIIFSFSRIRRKKVISTKLPLYNVVK